MIAAIISFVVVFLSFNLFMMSYQINGINRLVIGAPLSLFETAINMYGIDFETGPYFDKEFLEDNITTYFDFHMPRYVETYELSFYYYNIEDHSIDMDDECRAVEVNIDTDLFLANHYHRTMYYEIRSH